jgi:hypothetical protein
LSARRRPISLFFSSAALSSSGPGAATLVRLAHLHRECLAQPLLEEALPVDVPGGLLLLRVYPPQEGASADSRQLFPRGNAAQLVSVLQRRGNLHGGVISWFLGQP